MRIRAGEVRRLKTNDFVLVIAVSGSYITVVPVFNGAKSMVGRYLEFKDVQFALDFPATINPILVGDFVATIPLSLRPKVGKDAPSKFDHIANRMQMLSYIESQDDINRVLRAARKR